MAESKPNHEAHIVFLPCPAQGHIKSMLILAQLLSRHGGFGGTFVNSDHNQARLEASTDVPAFYVRFPKLRFASIPDGLPPDHPRNGSRAMEVIDATRRVMKPAFRELLVGLLGRRRRRRICVVSDVFMSLAVEVGEEIGDGVKVIPFQSFGATSTWVYLHVSKLVEDGQVPFQGAGDDHVDMEKPITGIPGLDGILRRQDLPFAWRSCREPDDPFLQFLIQEMATLRRASRNIIINTFEGLESPAVSELRALFPRVYCVGPLHGLLESSSESRSSVGMLEREDRSCLSWLDTKLPRSVIYVSLGSWSGLSLDQIVELRHGLVNSGKWFLWVIRRDVIVLGEDEELDAIATAGERGCIVEWAPQEEVLRHPAVGGFFTHSGWNSTVESVLAGVPMICWSQAAEQAINSRCVGELWKVGIDVKGRCDRLVIERTVRDLMEGKREDLRSSIDEMATVARSSVQEGGSSYRDLLDLIEDLRHITQTTGSK